ncbi:MAG TPA: hypothetical protein VHJ20_21950 [Polyangia bacterium]|nr:hypothetical protein [Polyangia bacterium]
MDVEQTEIPTYMEPTAPEWAIYYKRAKKYRRFGKDQHARIKDETKRRRRKANVMLIVSTAVLLAVVFGFCALLGT